MDSDEFNKQYKRLNPAQRKAVDAVEGSVMVIAGPGTGKTSILTLRIANILRKTDAQADSILALTFTESGVHSMRRKLSDIMGAAAYKVNIYTFHGFCNDVIKNFPEEFPKIIGSNSAVDVDQVKIMEEIIEETKLEILKPYGDSFHYLKSALDAIKEMKRENISPDEFADLVKKEQENFNQIEDLKHESGKYKGMIKGKYEKLQRDIFKNKELLVLYKKYQKALEKKRLYDYEDMIMETVGALSKNKSLLLELQEKYQYILADEHQDANNAQNKLLELLSGFHDNPNIFIVGDLKQAIYRFQGASLENFLYFKKLHKEAVMINLEENYRSTQNILDASHSLIKNNKIEDQNLLTRLRSNKKENQEKVLIGDFENSQEEMAFVVGDIQNKIKNGTAPREIAVLYRNNKDAMPIQRMLEKSDVPFSVISDSDLLSEDEIRKLVLLLKSINDLNDDSFLSELLFVDFFKLPNLDIYKIFKNRAKSSSTNIVKRRNDRSAIVDIIRSEKKLLEFGVENPEAFVSFGKKMLLWNSLSKNKGLVDFFEIVVRECGIIEHMILSEGSLDKLSALDDFFEEVKKLSENHKEALLSDFVKYLQTFSTHKILIKKSLKSFRPDAVSLMTAHKSKGLEFEYVYITGAINGRFGGNADHKKFNLPIRGADTLDYEKIDDERRLFYVALTRAKKQAIITWPKIGSDGRELIPSQFVEEIDKSLVQKIDSGLLKKDLTETIKGKFKEKVNHGVTIKDRKFLQELFLEQGLSVSALNSYLDCPWRYFFNNLVRIPAAKDKWALYGTAVHSAIKEFFDKYREDKNMSRKEFLDSFENYLEKQPLSESEFEESLIKGKRALGGWFDFYKNSWPKNLLTEFNIAGVFLPFGEDKREKGEEMGAEKIILLKGKLDKIELDENGNANVVDYKTGKIKSRNDIEGKTKSSNGDYKRQLIFYKILLDNYEKGRLKMQSGEIEFLEPDEKGNYHREKFFITDEEVNELKELIEKVSAEIFSFSFWDKICDDKECEWCALAESVRG